VGLPEEYARARPDRQTGEIARLLEEKEQNPKKMTGIGTNEEEGGERVRAKRVLKMPRKGGLRVLNTSAGGDETRGR